MYSPAFDKLLARLFGGVKDHHRLSPAEVQLAKPIVDQASRSLERWLILGWFGIVGAVVGGKMLRDRLTGPAVNPIVDQREFWGWLSVVILAIVGTAVLGLVVRPILLKRRLAAHGPLFNCYMATEDGWLPHRSAWFWGILTLPLGALGVLSLMGLGDCIDERGILALDGPIPRMRTYEQVTSIELYDQINAPVGLRTVPNMVVRFDDGTAFNYIPGRDRRLPSPSVVGAFISAHSGEPVQIGGVRP
jgi:hypothetical protein